MSIYPRCQVRDADFVLFDMDSRGPEEDRDAMVAPATGSRVNHAPRQGRRNFACHAIHPPTSPSISPLQRRPARARHGARPAANASSRDRIAHPHHAPFQPMRPSSPLLFSGVKNVRHRCARRPPPVSTPREIHHLLSIPGGGVLRCAVPERRCLDLRRHA